MEIIIGYSIFCIIVFLIALKKITNNTFIKYIIAIWTISSLFSIIYYNASKEYTRITIMPYIFFIVSMLCILYPMAAYNDKRMIITLNNAYAFKCVVVFLCIISILPFIENIIHVISTYSISSSSALADIYDDKMSGDLNKTKILSFYSFPGKICNSLNLKFQKCSLLLLFIYLCQLKKNKYILIGLIIASINPILYSLIFAGRSSVVFSCVEACFYYFFFKNYLSAQTKSNIKQAGIILFSFAAIGFAIMTLARYNNSEGAQSVSLLGWISLYAGEGTLNFNNYMWHTHAFTEGDNCFGFFKSILGFNTFTDLLERRAYWGPKMGISPVRYYTFIGDFYSDLSYFTLPILLIIGLAIKKVFSRKRIKITTLYMTMLVMLQCITGFTCYTNKVYSATFDLVVSILIIYFLNSDILRNRYHTTKFSIIPNNLKSININNRNRKK